MFQYPRALICLYLTPLIWSSTMRVRSPASRKQSTNVTSSPHTHTHSWMSVKGTCSMLQCTQGTCFHGQRPPGLGLETHDHETCIFIYAHALPSRAALTVTIYTRTSSSYLRQRLVWCMGEQVEVPNANHQPQQFSCRLLFNSIDARRRWC